MKESNSSEAPNGKLPPVEALSEPTSLNSALRTLAHAERLRCLRNWLLGSGIAAICLAVTFIPGGLSNPKWWSTTFSALRVAGYFQPFARTSFFVGCLLLIGGALTALVLRRMK